GLDDHAGADVVGANLIERQRDADGGPGPAGHDDARRVKAGELDAVIADVDGLGRVGDADGRGDGPIGLERVAAGRNRNGETDSEQRRNGRKVEQGVVGDLVALLNPTGVVDQELRVEVGRGDGVVVDDVVAIEPSVDHDDGAVGSARAAGQR